MKSFSNHNCGRSTVLFAGRNPFKRNESNVHDSAVEREQKLLTSTSALFSSPKSRGRSINFTRNEGTSSNDMHPEDVGAVRNASVLGGFLSIVFTRDIWYAVSSFLLINMFASQSNPVGVFIRSIGQRMDNLQAEISRKRMILRIVNFLKAVNEASLLDKSPSKHKEIIKRPPRSMKAGGSPDTPITVSSLDDETGNRSGRGRNYFYPVTFKTDELETDISNRISDTYSSSIESLVRSPERNPSSVGVTDLIESSEATVTVTASHGTHQAFGSSSPDIDAIRSTIYRETSSIPEIEHNSEAVIKATIEVQAAADAASARLKAWITQQKLAEEEKKKLKLSTVSEITRVRDLPRLRDELLMHMSIFVSGNISERKSLTVATANTTTATSANSPYPVFLTSFSCRAVESSAGSISDFILVLTSPGDECSFLAYFVFSACAISLISACLVQLQ